MRPTRRTLMLYFAVEALLFGFLVFALLDRRARQRDQIDGVNQWGYRFEAHGSKEPGERRVAIVGGSSAFEGGNPYAGTLAGRLYIELRQAGAPDKQVYSVVNLAEPRAGADSYVETLRAYHYLEPDVVCVFDGYDLPTGTPPHGRRQSRVFRSVGYLPVLPARIAGRPAWLSDPDGGVAEILQDGTAASPDVTCEGASAVYCAAIADTVRFALAQRYAVVVVSPPSVSSRHRQQQQSLAAFLRREVGGAPRFMYLDLGSAFDLSDPVHSPDRLHRTEIGNHVIGQRIATAILKGIGGTPGFFSSRAGGS